MGRSGRGPSPNDDRSRSMNPQDPVGQAAMANEARQRGDDGDWDDDGYDDDIQSEEVVREEPVNDNINFGEISRDGPVKTGPKLVDDGLGFYGYDWTNLKAKPKPKSSYE